MIWIRWCCAFVLMAGLSACNRGNTAPTTPAPTATSFPWQPSQALTNLPAVRLWLGARELDAELCLTREQVSTGLMFRKEIKDDQLMLFVFRDADRASFYMKNVPFDIDVAYIGSDGTISEIVRLKAFDEQGVLSKSDNIQFVLEAAPDWFKKNNLRPGGLIRTPQGSLREVLGPKAQVTHRME